MHPAGIGSGTSRYVSTDGLFGVVAAWCRCSVTGNAGDGSYRVDDVACHPPFLSQANFSSNYAVYHHLRACGWVPKAGIKFGVEFLAYRLVLHVR